jgi:peptide-methionine (R)-S-oxide reductase
MKDSEYPFRKSIQEWKAELDPEVFHVTREAGTEPPFTGEYYLNKKEGVYHCSNCQKPLFTSDAKYHSGSGWPSFTEAVNQDIIEEIRDTSHGMVRTEIRCKNCGAHLGHVFPDGPGPTGLRYCVNSLSLTFEEKE